jgi:hypothetical protein
LPPSPIELRQERLSELAGNRRPPQIPRPEHHQRPREGRDRTPKLSRSVERRTRRDRLPQQLIGMSLREAERNVLSAVGRFRVIATRDLAQTVYDGRYKQMQQDLRFLREHGLVEIDMVRARRDGRSAKSERIEVITLTKEGRSVARQASGLPDGQKLYSGMVKPREVEHDTQIYRAYLKEAERIERSGGTNLRVQLDFELKSQVQKSIYRERKVNPDRDITEIKQRVAEQFDLPFVNGGIQIPDARITYDLEQKNDQEPGQGSLTGHQDIEVLTAAYRPGHLRNKAQAGFHVYASRADRSSLAARIEGDHHLMENILEL